MILMHFANDVDRRMLTNYKFGFEDVDNGAYLNDFLQALCIHLINMIFRGFYHYNKILHNIIAVLELYKKIFYF